MKTGSDFAGRNQTVVCSQCQFYLQVLVRFEWSIHWIDPRYFATLKYVCPYRWNKVEIPILISFYQWYALMCPKFFECFFFIFCKFAHVKLLFLLIEYTDWNIYGKVSNCARVLNSLRYHAETFSIFIQSVAKFNRLDYSRSYPIWNFMFIFIEFFAFFWKMFLIKILYYIIKFF